LTASWITPSLADLRLGSVTNRSGFTLATCDGQLGGDVPQRLRLAQIWPAMAVLSVVSHL